MCVQPHAVPRAPVACAEWLRRPTTGDVNRTFGGGQDDRPHGTRTARASDVCPSSRASCRSIARGCRTELIAGATLAALAMPEVMGYTKIAGMPVITGLYTLVLPMLAFAIFGSSRHLVVGADSATAAVLATGLAGIAAPAHRRPPSTSRWPVLAALMCGVLLTRSPGSCGSASSPTSCRAASSSAS